MDNLAPYTPSMRPGQGYNSFLQETCMPHRVSVVETPKEPWTFEFSCRLVEDYRDIVSSQHISPGAVMKRGLASLSSKFAVPSHERFKESTLNYVITSSIRRRQIWEGKGFQPLNGEKGSISALYGDCFIGGFIDGSEIVVYVSLAAKQGTDIQELRRAAGPALGIQGFRRGETEAVESEIHEAVAKLKELTTSIDVYVVEREGGLHSGERDLENQLKYLALVDKRMRKVEKAPSKLFAVLTPYRELVSFHEASLALEPLNYEDLSTHPTTYRMLGDYLEYQLLYSQLQRYSQEASHIFVGGAVALDKMITACEHQLGIIQANVRTAAIQQHDAAVGSLHTTPSEFTSEFFPKMRTITVYVGEAPDPHRCIFSLQPIRNGGWKTKTSFKAYSQPDISRPCVRVSVAEAHEPHRTMVLLDEPLNRSGWKEYLSFYAFRHEQDEAKMIVIGEAHKPHRCMLFEEAHSGGGGWTERLHFWVPHVEGESGQLPVFDGRPVG